MVYNKQSLNGIQQAVSQWYTTSSVSMVYNKQCLNGIQQAVSQWYTKQAVSQFHHWSLTQMF